MENLDTKEVDYLRAKERVRKLKKFYASLLIFALVFLIYGFIKYYKTGDFNFLELNNWSAIFWIWGIILVVNAFKLFVFNQNWERKMIDKQLYK